MPLKNRSQKYYSKKRFVWQRKRRKQNCSDLNVFEIHDGKCKITMCQAQVLLTNALLKHNETILDMVKHMFNTKKLPNWEIVPFNLIHTILKSYLQLPNIEHNVDVLYDLCENRPLLKVRNGQVEEHEQDMLRVALCLLTRRQKSSMLKHLEYILHSTFDTTLSHMLEEFEFFKFLPVLLNTGIYTMGCKVLKHCVEIHGGVITYMATVEVYEPVYYGCFEYDVDDWIVKRRKINFLQERDNYFLTYWNSYIAMKYISNFLLSDLGPIVVDYMFPISLDILSKLNVNF